MSALRAVFNTRLPLAGIRISTHSISSLKTDGSLQYASQSAYSALSCRSISTVQSTDKVKRKPTVEEEEENDEPVKFTTSKAANWKAEYTWRGTADEMPPIQPFVVSFSIGVLLLYFFVLREENDIDQKLAKDLEDFV